LLFELFSRPTQRNDVDLPQATEKYAHRLRLRYYSFLRTKQKEMEQMANRALRNRDSELAAQAEQLRKQLREVRRFKVQVLGTVVRFTDRDKGDEEINNKLTAMLMENNNTNTLPTAQSDNFEDLLSRIPEAAPEQVRPRNPLDNVVEETRDTPIGLTASALIDRTVTRLQHGGTPHIRLPFDKPESANAFVDEWTTMASTRPDLPPHEIATEGREVVITRKAIFDL
jgi:hypothetical protein